MATNDPKAIQPKELAENIDNFLVIDVRDKGYFLIDHIKNAINITSPQRIGYIAQENEDKKILLYCHKGITAKNITNELAKSGIQNVYYVCGSFGEITKSGVEITYYNKEQ